MVHTKEERKAILDELHKAGAYNVCFHTVSLADLARTITETVIIQTAPGIALHSIMTEEQWASVTPIVEVLHKYNLALD